MEKGGLLLIALRNGSRGPFLLISENNVNNQINKKTIFADYVEIKRSKGNSEQKKDIVRQADVDKIFLFTFYQQFGG